MRRNLPNVEAALVAGCLGLFAACGLSSGTARAESGCGDSGAVRRALIAGLGERASLKNQLQQARGAFEEVPPACRNGAFYVDAANILRLPENRREPLAAEGLRLASVKEALTAGLQAEPNHPELLAFVAYYARLRPDDSPPLPPDACDRVKSAAAGLRGYVCGVAAWQAGRFADSLTHLRDIPELGKFPDAAQLLADSMRKTKEKAAPQAKAPPAAQAFKCDPFCSKEVLPPASRPRR